MSNTGSNFGATSADWEHFSTVLGLTKDLLPVVSNPNAVISPESTMKGLGKTPSLYNGIKQAVGLVKWTSKESTQAEVAKWSKQPDYGICLQTREVRAIDIDIEDVALASCVVEAIGAQLNWLGLPTRYRSNSGKCLLVFRMPGEMPKRVIKLAGGIIELLANGQQFIACGMHTSGVRYEWLDELGAPGLPHSIPELSLEEVDALWSALASEFAAGESVTSTSPTKSKVLSEAVTNDADAQYLIEHGWVKQIERDGRLHITCPFEEGHSTESSVSATTYFPANTGGYQFGHYDCRHASCEHRTDDDFRQKIGIPVYDPFDDFDVIEPSDIGNTISEGDQEVKANRFAVVPAHEFALGKAPGWIVKNVLPKAGLGVVFGESGSGKTFWIMDVLGAVAQGLEWRGCKVQQGRSVLVAAEGVGGVRSRFAAYSEHTGVPLNELGIGVIPDAPNFMQVEEVKDVIRGILAYGKVSVVVVDTFAQVMPGSNENSGEDVGKALKHCREIHRITGALVILIHHAGKDTSKGARGWSGLRAAADVEIEVARCDDDRVATITKLKDGRDGLEFGFKLKTVVLGLDEDDDEITSCVVEHVEGGVSRAKANSKGKGKAGVDARVRESLMESVKEMLSLGDGRVEHSLVVDEVAGTIISTTQKDNRRVTVVRVMNEMVAEGALVLRGGFLSLPAVVED